MSQQSPRRQGSGGVQTRCRRQNQRNGTSKDGRRTCPECDGSVKREDSELICSECGLVTDAETFSRELQWESAPDRDGESIVSGPEVKTDRWTTSTVIGSDFKSGYGDSFSPERRAKFNRLQQIHRQRGRHETNTTSRGVNEIKRMGSALDIPSDVRETGIILFKRGVEEEVVRSRSIEGVASAAIYIASRQAQLPYTLDDIVRVSRLTDRTRVGRAYRSLAETLGVSVPLVNASEFISRFASALDLGVDIERLAVDIFESYKTDEAAWGRSPTGIAAAVIYAACRYEGLATTQQDISEVADVSPLTIRKQYSIALNNYQEENQ